MIAAESANVLDPERRSFYRCLDLTAEDLGRLLDAIYIRSVSEYLVDVVQQLVRCEVLELHRQTVPLVVETLGVVDLVKEHRKTDHRNSVIDGFMLSVVTAMGDKQLHGRMRQNFILW